jgi:DNA transformation protein
MSDIKGDRLFVNLSATETRRRLAGRGLGVRKVFSHGRNQAVVVHNAAGKHRETLVNLFQDVGWSERESELGEPIQNLRNLGPTSSGWLRDVGIRTIEDLRKLGPVTAYRLVRERERGCSLNLLWALAAGLTDRDWRELSSGEQEDLRSLCQ